MSIHDFIKKVKNNEIDIVEHTQKVIEECKEINTEYNYFNTISEELALQQANNIQKLIKNKDKPLKNKKLLGVVISVKDGICVKDVESTAGSRILQGYKPLFDAFVIQRVKEEGGIIIGKTSQDEFGFGSFSVNIGVGYKVPKNPIDKERSCGGSSGGAAGISKKASFPHISLGESTGGSIAEPASFCDVFGLCPTYGRVSRYGLIDFGNSLDKIGPIGRTIEDVALLMDVIEGYGKNDSTSLNVKNEDYSKYLKKSIKEMKVGIIKEAFAEGVEPEVEKNVYNGIEELEEEGAKAEEISLELPIKYGLATYYMIGTSEASTNLAKYCGMRYGISEKLEGSFNEYFTRVRSKNLGDEAKRRIILGTFARMAGYRDAYYIKAMKVRTLMIQEYKKAFKKFDALVSPTVPILPPKFSEIEKLTPLQNYMMDVMLVGPNVAGLPHLNVPVGYEKNLPVGMLLIADHLQEGKLIQLGSAVEKGK
ncbi:Asp-tRNA(Asn)/Glu-tRNA(Gln) amidotransferase subunit GatA [Candidatus Woesearchaeota archaeon]|nr:Asp-tRNA(Asn)/Glu-tRNA(Gln) amidotransferase subunit GatA [Candidatus Woesearchaeota archaeon]